MYRSFFNLRERPFELTPNPKYLYLTGKHREALSNLQYGIAGRKGITVLTGEAGTGKTTIVRAAMDALACPSVHCVYLSNPILTRGEFYEYLAPRFGLSGRAALSKAHFLAELEDCVLARRKAGGATALIVDEAQSLPHELMEEVRLLANFETADEKLLQVVLAGQPELAERLEHEELRQLKQRVALRCQLLPLDVGETASYISGRIAIAGGLAVRIFTREAIQAIHHYSRGIPRTISVICDNALVTAFAAGTTPIDSAVILDVCRDFGYRPKAPADERVQEAQVPVNAPSVVADARVPGNDHRPVPDLAVPAPREGDAGPTRGELPAAPVPVLAATDAAGPREMSSGREELFGSFTKKKRFRFF